MQLNAFHSQAADLEPGVNDLGPLAWVLDELRKSLESAVKALRRFVRDAEQARGSDLAALDSSQLRIARQQLHQSVGALEMIGLPAPALVLKAMETAVQRFVQQPENCTSESAAKLERASFALTEYLQGVLSNRPVSSVSLFPQYREIQEIVRAERIHPADLWQHPWRWLDPHFPLNLPARGYGPDSRAALDQAMLRLMKGKAGPSAQGLRDLCLGLSTAETRRLPKIFWKISAAFFEALGHDLLEPDIFVKRATSRILLQYAALAKGDDSVSDRLAQDLIFFCAQSRSSEPGKTPLLAAVRTVYKLTGHRFVDYELVQFGRFDPALLAQARKRINSAKETWSALAAGDVNKFKGVSDQFSLVTSSLVKLHPASEHLARALTRAIDTTVRLAQPPRIELAMEVATSIMYLEAAFVDLDPSDPLFAIRTRDLADRLDGVDSGGEPQPLEAWMEELYSRVSDKQTMGSVVGELRISLGELEKGLDNFFRDPTDKTPLQTVPSQLSQMRGVLSILGLDQAAQTVGRMRDGVEKMLETDVDAEQARAAGTFDHLGNNVGALSFLIDMLNYQPALAKRLFVFDEKKGELRPVMGRVSDRSRSVFGESVRSELGGDELAIVTTEALAYAGQEASLAKPALTLDAMESSTGAISAFPPFSQESEFGCSEGGVLPQTVPSESAAPYSNPDPSVQTAPGHFEEDDLLEIFLEEAREVTTAGRDALSKLADRPGDLAELTVLRRAFHTLKGSSRMVGLTAFGDAAWSFEQLNNSWLADQKTTSDEFRVLTLQALAGFESWITSIASRSSDGWTSLPFSTSADAMRIGGAFVALTLEGTPASALTLAVQDTVHALDLSDFDLELGAQQGHQTDQVGNAVDFGYVLSGDLSPQIEVLLEPLPEISARGFEISDLEFSGLADLQALETADVLAKTLLPEQNQISEDAQVISEPDFNPLLHVSEMAHIAVPAFTEGLRESSPSFQISSDFTRRSNGVVKVSALPHAGFAAAPEILEKSALAASLDGTQADAGYDLAPGYEDARASVFIQDRDQAGQADEDEKFRLIGSLRIGIPLYNVYLNEADEWSRRLVTEISEWSIEGNRAVSDGTVALAHSLAGSSATVGFQALSDIARTFEHALQKSQAHYSGQHSSYSTIFVNASEEIRRLLHQFAAGFLKMADEGLLEQLKNFDFPDSLSHSASDPLELDFQQGQGPQFSPVKPDRPPAILESMSPRVSGAVGSVELPSGSDAVVTLSTSKPTVPPLFRVAARASTLPVKFADDEDGIDALDAIDPELFPIFEEEAAELMPQLGSALRQWSARPGNQSARIEVLRVLHTLKGSARLAGAMCLGEMAHRIESQIESLGSEAPPANEFDELLSRFDAMQGNFDGLRYAGATVSADAQVVYAPSIPSSAKISSFEDQIAASLAGWPTKSELLLNEATEQAPAGTPALASSEGAQPPVFHGDDPIPDVERRIPAVVAEIGGDRQKVVIPPPQPMVMTTVRKAAGASVRVRSQLLDRMVNQAGEVIITRSRLEAELSQLRASLGDMSNNLNRLRQHLRDIELQAETQMQSRLAQAKEAQAGFDPLEIDRFTRVQELTRMMAESVNDVATVQRTLQRTVEATEDDLIAQARQTRELQRDLLRTRMVEFESIADRLYRVVRQASKDSGKQVKLDLLGATIEMDRSMLDRMTSSFEHLLRNCVAHGIEDQPTRIASGKDPVGVITVHLRHEGNDVSVSFSDDGAGLDLGRIHSRAVAQGMVSADKVLTQQEAADLIFLPGFTTAAQVTELAGRGIGMDVVRSEVNALGGRIETTTVEGKGTHFKLVLPLTTAVTQVVMIRTGSLTIGVPANLIEVVRRVSPRDLEAAYATGSFDLAGSTLPFFWSGTLLQASRQSVEPAGRTLPVVIFRSADQRLALHVDEVLGNQEVVVKNLGPQMSRLPGLSGMSVLASGAVVLIYNPVALASIYGARAQIWATKSSPALPASFSVSNGELASDSRSQNIPLILVVDDSITVRRVTQRLLHREGFRVAMAADGLQALERLQEEIPSVVLSDIEMPRMDGFDLARNIRGDTRLKGLPIIMITSRIAEKHREHAMELGVDHYLGKPYSEDELIGLVRHYCATEATLAA